MAINHPAASQTVRELDSVDEWVIPAPNAPGSPAARLQEIQLVLARGEYERAKELASEWIERYPTDPLLPQAILAKGDAIWKAGNEYEALFEYEEVARRFPGSPVFVTALEREYAIGVEYAHGLKRLFLGVIRTIDASDDAQELLIRVQERLPGSELAELAGMELADFYFNTGQMDLAATSYDLFILNYPRSPRIDRARIRLIASYVANFKGPDYSATGLVAARQVLDRLIIDQANLARREGARALLARIRESEASKLLQQIEWYRVRGDRVSAERYLRALVVQYPDTTAMLDGLRQAPALLEGLPTAAMVGAPDYSALRLAFLAASTPELKP